MCFAQIACSVTTRGEKAEEILSKGLQVKEYELKVYTLFCESREQRAERREQRAKRAAINHSASSPSFFSATISASSLCANFIPLPVGWFNFFSCYSKSSGVYPTTQQRSALGGCWACTCSTLLICLVFLRSLAQHSFNRTEIGVLCA